MALSLAELEKDYKKWEAGKAKQAEMANKSKQAPAKNRTVPVLESKAEKAQRVQQANDLQSLQMANDLMASQKSVPVQQDMSMPSSVNKLSGTMDMGLPTGVTKFGDSKPSNLNLNNKPSESLEPMKKGGATWTKEYDYENAWKPLDRTERQKLEREARNIQSKGTSASIEEMDRLREIYDIVDENDRKVAVNDKSNIDKYLSPNYRLSSQEESIAKEMIDNYFNENPNAKKLLQASSSNANRASKIRSQMTKREQEEYAKMTALMNKTSNLSAFTYGMLNIMPFGNTAMDKMGELMGVDDAYNYSAQEKNIKTQSPLAYTGGDMASKLAAYSVLGGEIEKIPALAKATNKAGAFLSGGNKVAGDMIGNVLRGDLADIALDTIPTEIENFRNGMSGADIAKDTAKNLLVNTAFNAVGEVVPYLWKSARGQLGNVAEEVADIPGKTNLEMEREALQSSQNDWDALRAELNRRPTNLEMEQAANVDNMDVLRQAMAEQQAQAAREEAERIAREQAEQIAKAQAEQAVKEIPQVGEQPSLIAKTNDLTDESAPVTTKPSNVKQFHEYVNNKKLQNGIKFDNEADSQAFDEARKGLYRAYQKFINNPTEENAQAIDDYYRLMRKAAEKGYELDNSSRDVYRQMKKDFADRTKGMTIRLSDTDMAEMTDLRFKDINRKLSTLGNNTGMKVRQNSGTPIDSVWDDLVAASGGQLDPNLTNTQDMIRALVDYVDDLQMKVKNPVTERIPADVNNYIPEEFWDDISRIGYEASTNATKPIDDVIETSRPVYTEADIEEIRNYENNRKALIDAIASGQMNPDELMQTSRSIWAMDDYMNQKHPDLFQDGNYLGFDDASKTIAEDIGLNPNTMLDDEANIIEEEIPRNEPYDLTFDPGDYEEGTRKVSKGYTNTGRKGNGWNETEYNKYTDPSNYTYESKQEIQSVNKATSMREDEGYDAFRNRVLEKELGTLESEEVDGLMMDWRETVQEARELEASGGDAAKLWERSNTIFRKIQQEETHNAQALQALAKWSRNTPEGMLMQAEQIVNKKLQKSRPRKSEAQKILDNLLKKHSDVEFSAEFQKKFLEEADKIFKMPDLNTREAKDAMANLGKMVSNELPVKLPDKVTAFLMDNMLGNFRTLITRNAGGNVGLNAVEQVAQRPLAAGIDKLVAKKTGVRTQAGLSKAGLMEYMSGFKKGLSDELHDFKTGLHTSRTGENTMKNAIDSNRHVFKEGGVMDKFDSLVKNGLSIGDRPFYEAVYKQTLGDYQRLRAAGQMGEAIQNLSDADFDKLARTAANMNALAAVYQNDSLFAQALLKFKGAIGELSEGTVGVDLLSQFSMPFVKTPANVVDRAIDYSPIGIVRNAIRTSKEGGIGGVDFDQNRFVNETARNILGTGFMGAAAAGAKAGRMTGGFSDDKEEKAAQKERGMQEYALRYHKDGKERNMDISWIPVVGSNAVAAAAAYDAYKNGEGNTLENIGTGLVTGGEALFDQSMFQGLQRLFGSDNSYDEDKGIVANALNTVKQGVGQAVPSLVRQIAQASDPYQRDVSNSNGGNYELNNIIRNIPGARQALLAPKVDSNGNIMLESQGRGLGHRILEDMILPGKVTEIQNDRLGYEADRISDITGNPDAYKPKANVKDIQAEGRQLTNDQIVKYEQDFGKAIDEAGNAVMDNAYYKSLDTSRQERLLDNVYKDVRSAVNSEYNGKQIDGGAKAYKQAYDEAGGGDAGRRAGIQAAVDYHMSKELMGTSSAWAREIYNSGDTEKIDSYQSALKEAQSYGLNGITKKQWQIYDKKGYRDFIDELEITKQAKDVGFDEATQGFRDAISSGMTPEEYAEEDQLIKSIPMGEDEFGETQYLDHDETSSKIYREDGEDGLRDFATIKQAGGDKKAYDSFRLYTKKSKSASRSVIPSLDPEKYMTQVSKIEKYNPEGKTNGSVSQEELEAYMKAKKYSLDDAQAYAQAFFGDEYTVAITKKGKYDIKKKATAKKKK